jgi:hypothetical protein
MYSALAGIVSRTACGGWVPFALNWSDSITYAL